MGLLSFIFGGVAEVAADATADAVTGAADRKILSSRAKMLVKLSREEGLHFTSRGKDAPRLAPALAELSALGVPAAPEEIKDVVSGPRNGLWVLAFDNPHHELANLDSGGHFWFTAARLPHPCPDVIARAPWEVRHAALTPVTRWFPHQPHHVAHTPRGRKERGVFTDHPAFAARMLDAASGVDGSMKWAVRGQWAFAWNEGIVTRNLVRKRLMLLDTLAHYAQG
ncbi:hypothetical protein [Nocardiopsis suaedae]|uniref:Uncharacterized protein n=1 Tax=Nocardiopsis suaedae TaxID=3018444 RepID=A0ABT4TN67_9ACTN|nr:hypothetical protein [Nocardiopsis suaedae]MDA2806141.1 hypothetical protein [Nocardiopsis suaedae]